MLAIHGCGGHQFALEAHRRSVTEGRMSAASIVPTFDPFKDRQLRLDLRAKVAPIEQLTFQRGEKRFGHGVVVRISDRTNGWHDAHFAAALAEGEARVLRAVIGMMNHSVLGPALCERHVDGREHQLSFQMIFHRPADDFARACIQHDRQKQKPRPRRNIGNISHPEPIELVDLKVPIDQIRREIRVNIDHRGAHEAPARHPAQARRTHQARDALFTDVNVVIVGELRMDPRHAVGFARAAVDGMNFRAQGDVLERPLRQRALIPGIKTARRNSEQSAHQSYRKLRLVRFHESVEGFVFGATSCANQAAAFDRISLSSLSWRTSRLSFVSSSRSALVKPPSPRPASRSACLTQPRIDQTEHPNSLLSSAGFRPARTSSTICCRNSGAYRLAIFDLLDLRMTNSPQVHYEESTKAGQLHRHVKANRGAAGIDGESIEMFEANLKDNLYRVWNRMSSGSYMPPAIRLVEIPKKTGGVRALGIPTVSDRIAQTVVKRTIEPR